MSVSIFIIYALYEFNMNCFQILILLSQKLEIFPWYYIHYEMGLDKNGEGQPNFIQQVKLCFLLINL